MGDGRTARSRRRRSRRDSGLKQVVNAFSPLIDHVVDTFGADRCMFASNFPIDKVSLPLPTLLGACRGIAGMRSQQAQEQLFRGTAESTYDPADADPRRPATRCASAPSGDATLTAWGMHRMGDTQRRKRS